MLFGDADPGGRLPVTFPASDTQGPAPATQPIHYPGVNGVVSYDEGLDVGYRWYDATGQRPLFPFGYGLSYEQFDVSGVRAFYNPFDGTAVVVARVEHLARPGPTTLELYLESPAGRAGAAQAAQGLHQREPWARAEPARAVPPEAQRPRVLQRSEGKFTVAPGRYTVLVGTSSTELDHAASFRAG